jgi:hypothetical protein
MANGTGGKLNPFQIEDEEKWEGDFYDEDDDDDDDFLMEDATTTTREARGLLGHGHPSSSVHPMTGSSNVPSSKPTRRRGAAATMTKRSFYPPVGRILTVLGVTTIFFWIVLSATSTTKRNSEENKEPRFPVAKNEKDGDTADDPRPNLPPVVKRASPSPTAAPPVIRSAPVNTPPVPTTTTQQPTGGEMPVDDDEQDNTVDTDNNDNNNGDNNEVLPPHNDDFVPSEWNFTNGTTKKTNTTKDDDWTDDNSGGVDKPLRPYDPKPKPLFFIVLGERHSGVEYLLDVLQNCFGEEHRYGNGYHRKSPWFQTSDEVDVPFRMDAHMHYRVVLILATRNVYDWVQDMYHYPEYLGDAADFETLKLQDFLRSSWSYHHDPVVADNTTNDFCQLNFQTGQITPCLQFPDAYRFPTTVPVYELNPFTRAPYENILQFRAAKIRHWREALPQSWGMEPMVLHMDAEDGSKAWTTEFARDLLNRTAGEAICWPPTATNTTNTTNTIAAASVLSYHAESYANASSTKFMEWMNANVDWEMERKIGYDMMMIQRPPPARGLRS